MASLQDKSEGSQQHKPSILLHIMILMVAGAAGITAIALTHEWIVVEKLIKRLLMPYMIVGAGLFLITYFLAIYGNRYLFLFSLIFCALFYFTSNEIISDRLMLSLEYPYVSIDPLNGDPYEYVVVLGGGAKYPISQREQFGEGGDRIAVVAQMYHAKKVKKIILTGSQIDSLRADGTPSPGEIGRTLLERLNVPGSVIETSPGRNTSEEFSNLAKYFADREAGTRIGLITSAWHLPRALRLAKANGLELEPIPADFRSEREHITILSFLPDVGALEDNTLVLREYLAKIAGR